MSIVSCTGWSTLPGPMATEEAQQTYGDPRGPWMSRDEQAQAVGVAVKTITRARGIWLIDHGLLVAECPGCHERPPAPGEKLCNQCLEEKAAQPTKVEVLEARISELRTSRSKPCGGSSSSCAPSMGKRSTRPSASPRQSHRSRPPPCRGNSTGGVTEAKKCQGARRHTGREVAGRQVSVARSGLK